MPRRKSVPKKPRTAYVLFKKDQLRKNVDGCKSLTPTEFAAFAKRKWAAADKHDREMFQNFAKYDKLRHDTEMDDVCCERPKKKIKKFPNAFSLYVQKHSKRLIKDHGMKLCDACKQLAKKWSSMTDEEKKPFYQKLQRMKALAKRKVFMRMTGQLEEEDGGSDGDDD